nr:unnamed protein product [Callosobruchus analis]
MSENQLKAARIERGQVKAVLTRFARFIDEYTDDKIIQLEARLEKVEPLLEQFYKIQQKVELFEDSEQDDQETDDFEDHYYNLVEKAKALINDHYSKQLSVNPPEQAMSYVQEHQPLNHASNVKFPALELPKFYGDYDKWGQFRDMFTALVHNEPYMENVKKFYYLLSCLKGDAAKVVDSMAVTNDNYLTAWELLKSRFENPHIIVKNHVRALFELPSTTKDYHQSLRKLTDEVQKHIRSLEILGEPVDTWDTLLIYMITRKLDPASEKEWEESIITKGITSPRYEYNDLLNFLSDRCQLLEAVTSKYENQSNSRFEKVNRFEKRPNNTPVGNASHLVSNSVAIKCAYCKESQPLYTCSKLKLLPVASRYAEIRALKLCTNCLRSNHGPDKCIARGCKYCNKRHNTMLHSQQTPNEPSLNVNKEISNDERSPESAQTCGNWHRCRALIDNGSMPNIITRELSEKLNLTSHQTNIPITGVGKSYTRVSNKITTVIKSLVNEFSAKLSFLVLEKITENLPLTSFKLTQLNIPDNVVQADTQFNESQRIDLLLGAGIYHEMICAEVIKLGSGLPILQKTVLGYISIGSYQRKQNYIG